jgi:hypothetical protein
MKKFKSKIGSFKSQKIVNLLVLSIFFGINIPVAAWAESLILNQNILAGGLSLLEMPEDIEFPPLRVGNEDLENFAVPKLAEIAAIDSEGEEVATGLNTDLEDIGQILAKQKITIEDLRFAGGFQLDVSVSAFKDDQKELLIPVSNLGVLTFNANNMAFKGDYVLSPGIEDIQTPLFGNPESSSDYTMFAASEENPENSLPMNLIYAPANAGGRAGKWELYPAFKLVIPAKTPTGLYAAEVTYTLSEI